LRIYKWKMLWTAKNWLKPKNYGTIRKWLNGHVCMNQFLGQFLCPTLGDLSPLVLRVDPFSAGPYGSHSAEAFFRKFHCAWNPCCKKFRRRFIILFSLA
jgi:hypothetical protein